MILAPRGAFRSSAGPSETTARAPRSPVLLSKPSNNKSKPTRRGLPRSNEEAKGKEHDPAGVGRKKAKRGWEPVALHERNPSPPAQRGNSAF